jgi:hypothetical protein
MKPRMRRKIPLALALLCSAAMFFGCQTKPAKPQVREDLRSISHHYDVQEYERCLAEIRTALKANNTKVQRAILLLMRGMCHEEMGQQNLAKLDYMSVKMEFNLTSFAETAQRRLNGEDGDQREHLEVDCGGLGWRHARKQCNQNGVRFLFLPAGETLERFTAMLSVQSEDRPESIKTVEDMMDRSEANSGLRGDKVKRHLIERSANENYWEAEVWNPQKGATVSLVRVILTKHRMHFATFALSKSTLTDGEREKYMACLRKAKLVGN